MEHVKSLETSSERNILCKSLTAVSAGVRTVRKGRHQNFLSHSIWTSCPQQRQTLGCGVVISFCNSQFSLNHLLSLHLTLLGRSSPKFTVAFSLFRNLSSVMKLCIQVIVHAWSLYTDWPSPTGWAVFPSVLAAEASFTSETIIDLTRTTPYPLLLWIVLLTMVTWECHNIHLRSCL